jgi:hypothetical protein
LRTVIAPLFPEVEQQLAALDRRLEGIARRYIARLGWQPFLGDRMRRGRLASERCRAVRFDRDDRPEAPFVAQRARLREAGEQPEEGPRYRIVYWGCEAPDGRIVLVVVLAVGIAHPAPGQPSVFNWLGADV